jgi:hypothetical protein
MFDAALRFPVWHAIHPLLILLVIVYSYYEYNTLNNGSQGYWVSDYHSTSLRVIRVAGYELRVTRCPSTLLRVYHELRVGIFSHTEIREFAEG